VGKKAPEKGNKAPEKGNKAKLHGSEANFDLPVRRSPSSSRRAPGLKKLKFSVKGGGQGGSVNVHVEEPNEPLSIPFRGQNQNQNKGNAVAESNVVLNLAPAIQPKFFGTLDREKIESHLLGYSKLAKDDDKYDIKNVLNLCVDGQCQSESINYNKAAIQHLAYAINRAIEQRYAAFTSSVWLSVCLFALLCVFPSFCVSVLLSVCLSFCLCVCHYLSECLPALLFAYVRFILTFFPTLGFLR
jgi:hypothetical protein